METPEETSSLANSEDPDKRLHDVAFHRGLHQFIQHT